MIKRWGKGITDYIYLFRYDSLLIDFCELCFIILGRGLGNYIVKGNLLFYINLKEEHMNMKNIMDGKSFWNTFFWFCN